LSVGKRGEWGKQKFKKRWALWSRRGKRGKKSHLPRRKHAGGRRKNKEKKARVSTLERRDAAEHFWGELKSKKN